MGRNPIEARPLQCKQPSFVSLTFPRNVRVVLFVAVKSSYCAEISVALSRMEGTVSTALKLQTCVVSLMLVTGAAGAADICVKCTGPDASYDCVVNGSASADTVTKLYCITALAKVGPHASCAIDRASVSPCQGERKEFTLPASVDGPFGAPLEQNAGTPALPADGVTPVAGQEQVGEQPPPQTANDAPPKTVKDMVEKSQVSASLAETQKSAGDAAKSAGTALEKAGSAVGSAAKTSWKCLSSFFSNC